ncbi:H-NS family nucleoid-associated regulatory protein [Trinickia mobilis]|uniref:H-NS family nucleoid-associated regulatory protein n=1 Tax=Trinickia mobilis TaxID=2816356 RepID=UPI001A8CFA43|nr:H-NS family nucleoid-associated regulatory protein [Trinickia mobilis]
MATLEAIQKKIKSLQAQAEAIAAKQSSGVLDRIRDLMSQHGLTVADIDAHLKGAKRGLKLSAPRAGNGSPLTAAEKGKLPPKYLNPKTGETWSGHARPPAWIKDVKDRSKFSIAGNVEQPAKHASKVTRKGNYVRGAQPPMYRNPETGAEWSGRGRAPAWIAEAKDRSRFLIARGTAATVAASVGAVSKAKTAVKKTSAVAGATAHKGQRKGPQPANPKSGATWSGRGPAPAWLAGVKDRSKFLIGNASAVASDAGSASKAKPAAKKAVVKKAAAKTVKASLAPAAKKAAAKKALSATAPAKKATAKKVSPAAKAVVTALPAPVESGAAPTA